jgi:hypothetical protein
LACRNPIRLHAEAWSSWASSIEAAPPTPVKPSGTADIVHWGIAGRRWPYLCLEGGPRAVHRFGAEDVLLPLLGASLVPPSPPILKRGPWGAVSVHGSTSWVFARGNWSNVHCAGALPGRRCTSLVPWRNGRSCRGRSGGSLGPIGSSENGNPERTEPCSTIFRELLIEAIATSSAGLGGAVPDGQVPRELHSKRFPA